MEGAPARVQEEANAMKPALDALARVQEEADKKKPALDGVLTVQSFTVTQYHGGLKAVGLHRPDRLGGSLTKLCNRLLSLCDPDMIPNEQKLLETMAVSRQPSPSHSPSPSPCGLALTVLPTTLSLVLVVCPRWRRRAWRPRIRAARTSRRSSAMAAWVRQAWKARWPVCRRRRTRSQGRKRSRLQTSYF